MNTKQLRQKILDLAIRGKLVEYKIESWQNVRLGEVCDITSSKRIFKSEYTSFGVPFYRTKEIVELSHGKTVSTELFISNERYNDIKNSFDVPNNGDVLLSAVGTIGVSWVVDDRTFYFKDGNLLWLKKITSDSKYLKYTLDFHFAEHEIRNGSTYNALTIESLKKIFISLPPLAEQHRIVTAIDSAFEIIDEMERNKADLQTAVTAAKQKVLSLAIQGKLVGGDKEKWRTAQLHEIGDIVSGGTPSTNNPEYWEDGTIPWITPADLSGYSPKHISEGNRNITSKGLTESSARLMPKGSVLFSSRAPIGYVVIADNEVCTNQGFKSVVPHNVEHSEFLYYFLRASVDEIRSRASGTTFKEISGREFGKTIITLPPLAEQRRIVAAIEAAFEQLDYIAQNLN